MDGFRYYKKTGLGRFLSLEELSIKAPELFKDCLTIYESITQEDLTEFVSLK